MCMRIYQVQFPIHIDDMKIHITWYGYATEYSSILCYPRLRHRHPWLRHRHPMAPHGPSCQLFAPLLRTRPRGHDVMTGGTERGPCARRLLYPRTSRQGKGHVGGREPGSTVLYCSVGLHRAEALVAWDSTGQRPLYCGLGPF